MVAFTHIVVAGLMAIAVNALPQQMPEPSATPAPSTSVSAADLIKEPSAIKKFQKLLTSGEPKAETLLTGETLRKLTVFDFNTATAAKNAKGGKTAAANIDTFPILTGLGISTTVAFLNPCGINTPHIHPRATEFLTLVNGTNLKFGYVLENNIVAAGNDPEIAGYLNQFEGTVFPQGSIHFQFNDNCEPATFVATLNSEDPGTSQVAQNFFALDDGVVRATLGFPKVIDGSNIDEFRKMIPANLATDVEVCMNRCGMKY